MKKAERCALCKIKKTILIQECKCGNKYCLNCFPPFIHNCSYDYRAEHRKYLSENNPIITNSTLIRL